TPAGTGVNLAVGAVKSVHITATTQQGECGELLNVADVTVGNEASDPTGANEGSESLANVTLGNGTIVASLALDEHESSASISVNTTLNTIIFDPDGGATNLNTTPPSFSDTTPAVAPILNVAAFDWAVGNALAAGANVAELNFVNTQGNPGSRTCGDHTTTDTCFSVFYQARLADLNTTTKTGFVPAGLNTSYEITIVAGFQEQVTGVSSDLSTLTIGFPGANQTNNFYEVYYDNTPATFGNDLAGTGFNDGTKIM